MGAVLEPLTQAEPLRSHLGGPYLRWVLFDMFGQSLRICHSSSRTSGQTGSHCEIFKQGHSNDAINECNVIASCQFMTS